MPLLFASLLLLAPAAACADAVFSDSQDFTLNTTGFSPGGVSSADSTDFTLNTTGYSPGGVSSADSPDFVLCTANTPPSITCPTNLTVEFNDASGAVVNISLTTTDICPSVVLTFTPPSGSLFPIGMTTVTALAVDAASNVASCSFTVTVVGARGVKQDVLAEMIALRTNVTSSADDNRLDAAIASLTASLAPALWVDETHLVRKQGDSVFQNEKDAVGKLLDLIGDNRSTIPAPTLQGFIARLVKADRLLAVISVQEAAASVTAAKKIAEDQNEIALGDADAAAGNPLNAIEHYRNAWSHAIHLEVQAGILATGHGIKLHFLAFPGDKWVIETSTNLTDWVTAGSFTADADGAIEFDDPDSALLPARFYRVLSP